MTDTRVPVNIITGFLGVGKTTAILELLKSRAEGPPWSVLVNEFGRVPIDQAALRVVGDEGTQIAEVAGGCLCCTAGVNMQIAMARILSETAPERILIEPTGLGHPERLKEILLKGDFATTLRPSATLCLLDPRQFLNPRYVHLLTYWEQIKCADVVVINKTDLVDESQIQASLDKLAQEYPNLQHVMQTEQGRLDPAWLDVAASDDSPSGVAHDSSQASSHAHAHEEQDEVSLLDGQARRLESHGLDRHACGWMFDAEIQFAHDRLFPFLEELSERNLHTPQQAADRIKGVFNTDRGWFLYNAVGAESTRRETPPSEDSRVECISAGEALDWTEIETGLLACRHTQTGARS